MSQALSAAQPQKASPSGPAPLLCREIDLQLRRRQAGRTGHYPGLLSGLAVLALPLAAQVASQHGVEGLPHDGTPLRLTAILLTWLGCIRAAGGAAASMAEEAQSHSPQLLRHLPQTRSHLNLLLTKGLVVMLPLLLEWGLFLLVSVALFCLHVDFSLAESLRLAAVGLSALALSLSLGLWLGARQREPERAANNARIATFMLLLGWGMLERVLPSPLLVMGIVVWSALMFRSSHRVASVFQCSVLCTVMILMMPTAFPFSLSSNLRLAPFSPLFTEWSPENPATHCALYLGGAVLLALMSARQLKRG